MPLREADMEPFEIMVSESQERMLCVCEPARLEDVLAVCARWEVHGTAIGEVTDTGAMRIFRGDELVGDIPVAALVDDCPVYALAPQRPAAPLYDPPAATLATGGSVHEALLALLASPNLASRRPLFEQYDSIVQSRTVRRPEEADAAVLALPDGAALGVAIDGNGRRVAADPYHGTIAAMLECAANLACVGAEPLGVTNNLNFGNPEKPHIAWQLTEAVRGLGDACRALDVPVTGGNVSLYNESAPPGGPIYPTPVIGMVGRLPDARRAGRLGFARAGDAIALAGWDAAPSLAAGELAKLWGEPLPDGLPAVDLAQARAVLEAIRDAVRGRHAELLPRRRRGRLPGRGRRVLPGRRPRRDARPRAQRRTRGAISSASGPPGSCSRVRATCSRRSPASWRSTSSGRWAARRSSSRSPARPSRWALAELREAHAALARLFP